MIIQRKYFSEEKDKPSKEDKKDLYKKGIVAGSAIIGLGGSAEGLRYGAKKISKKVIKLPPEESMKTLKNGRYLVAAGVPLLGYSVYKYKKSKKDDDSKA